MKINYTKIGAYYLPNFKLKNNKDYKINRYGLLRLNYLKKYDKAQYDILLMKGDLSKHLFLVGAEAEKRINFLMEKYKKSDKRLDENNKEINQLEWVGLMNNYKNCAEEIVLKELIYTKNVGGQIG